MPPPTVHEALASTRTTPLVELVDIVKVFPGVRANDGVSLSLASGEILGLLGENGAGKSTLMSILYGLEQADSGSIRRDGREVRIRSPRDARTAGIAIVQQHFSLVPTLTVAENVILGQEPGRWLRAADIGAHVRTVCERYDIDVDPDAVVSTLSVGQRQRVEILKCLVAEAEVIVLDEPTAVLTPSETKALFATLRRLAGERRGVILITHKLDELIDVTDRIAVLRAGRIRAVVDTGSVDPPTLARMMVGRDVRLPSIAAFVGLDGPEASSPARAASRERDVVLRIDDVSVRDADGVVRLDHVSLEVGSGEVLGVAGVEGNGQRELVDVLCGVLAPDGGGVVVDGVDLAGDGPVSRRDAGVRVVTEDRHQTGVVLDMTVAENLVIDRFGRRPYSRAGWLSRRAIRAHAARTMAQFDVRAPGPDAMMRQLSGGNQQRAVLARELSGPLRVLVAAQPTRGLDVGAIEDVTDRLTAARDSGAAVVLVSSELHEVLALADRIAVLVDGRVVDVLDAAAADVGRLGELMAGLGGANRSPKGDEVP